MVKKLATPDGAVRTKVQELLNLITSRFKPLPALQLPAETLLATLKQAESPMVQEVALMYLVQAAERMSVEQKATLVRIACGRTSNITNASSCFADPHRSAQP